MAQTPYSETECLLAVMNGDDEHAEELAKAMTEREQREFLAQLRKTIYIVDSAEPTTL